MSITKKNPIIIYLVLMSLIVGVGTAAASSTLKEKVQELAEKLSATTSGKVIGVENGIVYMNLGEKDSIHQGSMFEVVRLGDVIMLDNKAYYKEQPVGIVKVIRVRKNLSFAKVVKQVSLIAKNDKVYQINSLRPDKSAENVTANSTDQKPNASATVEEIERFVDTGKISKIALIEFGYNGNFNSMTRNIYESLSVALIQKGFQVVERSKLDQILKEQKLGTTGLIDTSTAQKIGKLMGSNVVVLGSLSDMGNVLAIRARMVDVEKGVALTAAEVTVEKTPDVQSLLQQNVQGGDSTLAVTTNTRQTSRKRKKAPNKKLVKEYDGFRFELQGCEKSGTTVQCNYYITSLTEDKDLKIYGDSIFVDDFGNRFRANKVQLANFSFKRGWEDKVGLIQDVKTHASLIFSGVSKNATIAPLVELQCRTNDRFAIQFRKVPLTEK